MATVIIDVSLNSQDANAQAAQVGESIKAIREEQKQLKAANEETGVAFQSNAVQLRQLQQEQRAYIAIAQAADGSNNQLRAQLALLTQQYNALGKEERDNTTAGQALQIQIRGISDELKKNESAVGDNRRNVGNYKDALQQSNDVAKDATQGQKNLLNAVSQSTIGFKFGGDTLDTVTGFVKSYKQALDESKAAQLAATEAQQISVAATEASAAATARANQIGFQFTAGQATETEVLAANTAATNANIVATEAQAAATEAQTVATGAATNATKIFKVALASTGIGALVLIVVALLSYLSKFDPIMDKIEQAFAAVGSVVTRVTDIVVQFFKNIKSVGDLLSKIGSILADPIGSFKRLGNEIAEVARQAVALKKAQQDLEDQEKIQELSNARAIQQVKQLTIQAKNRALSEKERQNLLAQANKIDENNFKRQKEIADEKARIAYQDAKINANLTDQEIDQIKKRGLAAAFEIKDRKRLTDEQVDNIKAAQLEQIKKRRRIL